MRRNVTALLLAFGVVAGFGSGIASCARGHDRWADREDCHKNKGAHPTRASTSTTTEPAPPPPTDPAPPPPDEPAPKG